MYYSTSDRNKCLMNSSHDIHLSSFVLLADLFFHLQSLRLLLSLSHSIPSLFHLSRPVNNFLRLVEIRVDVQILTTRAKNKEKSVFDVSITLSISVNGHSPPSSVSSYSQWWDSIDFSSLEDYLAPEIKRSRDEWGISLSHLRDPFLPFIHSLSIHGKHSSIV